MRDAETSITPRAFQIEPLSDVHLADVEALYLEVFRAPPWSEPWTLEQVRSQLAELYARDGSRRWAVVEDGSLIGFAIGSQEAFGVFVIVEMAISPTRQRVGIGTALLRAIEDEMRTTGMLRIQVVTAPDKWPIRFYEKHGYALVHEFEDGDVLLERGLAPQIVYSVIDEDNLLFVLRGSALYLAELCRALRTSRTWGEFRAAAPEGEVESIEWSFQEAEIDRPADSDPFDPKVIGGYEDYDWPPWPMSETLDWMPRDIISTFGSIERTAVSGPYVALPESRESEIVAALRAAGFEVERADELVTEALSAWA